MDNKNQYIPPRPSGGLYRPSGVTSPSQILEFQAALNALGHTTPLTGREPVASQAVLRGFQIAYNLENVCRRGEAACRPTSAGRVYGPPLSPARLSEDGQWGGQTLAALSNYHRFTEGVAVTRAQQAAAGTAAMDPTILPTDGYGGGTGTSIAEWGKPQASSATPGKTAIVATQPAPVAPRPSAPAAPVAPVAGGQQPASTFPTGPVVAGVVGLAVIGLAVAYKRSQTRGHRPR